MMLRSLTLALCVALSLQSASCFMMAPPTARSSPSVVKLSMSNQSDNVERRFAASVLTAAYLFANVASMAPAFAAPTDFAGSSQVVAAKSGGRMGGRSSVGSRGSASSYSRSASTTNNYRSTTVIQQPAYVAPPVYGGYGYGYGVDAGTVGTFSRQFYFIVLKTIIHSTSFLTLIFTLSAGLTVGLNALSGISREMREQSQEQQIRDERQALSEARMREAELEGRLRALEAAQAR